MCDDRILEHDQRLFQIDDMNFVAMTEDIRGHLGVPEAGLVSKVDAGFQHFAHGNGHEFLSRVRSGTRPVTRTGLIGCGHPWRHGFAIYKITTLFILNRSLTPDWG